MEEEFLALREIFFAQLGVGELTRKSFVWNKYRKITFVQRFINVIVA